MTLTGITIDFNDKNTCGLLPELCLTWDERSDELEDNEDLMKYWENNTNKVLDRTENIVLGNIGSKSIIYSQDPYAIQFIKEAFPEVALTYLEYEDIDKCEHCILKDYLS